MGSTEEEVVYLEKQLEDLKKQIEIFKAKIRAEMMVLDKLLDIEDPYEIKQSFEKLKGLVDGSSNVYSAGMGIIGYMEEARNLKRKIEELRR